jgi:hypothetical protein
MDLRSPPRLLLASRLRRMAYDEHGNALVDNHGNTTTIVATEEICE